MFYLSVFHLILEFSSVYSDGKILNILWLISKIITFHKSIQDWYFWRYLTKISDKIINFSSILCHSHFLGSWLFIMKTQHYWSLYKVTTYSLFIDLVKEKNWSFSLWIFILILISCNTRTTNSNTFFLVFKFEKRAFIF